METNISTVSYSLRQAEERLVEENKNLKLIVIIIIAIVIFSGFYWMLKTTPDNENANLMFKIDRIVTSGFIQIFYNITNEGWRPVNIIAEDFGDVTGVPMIKLNISDASGKRLESIRYFETYDVFSNISYRLDPGDSYYGWYTLINNNSAGGNNMPNYYVNDTLAPYYITLTYDTNFSTNDDVWVGALISNTVVLDSLP